MTEPSSPGRQSRSFTGDSGQMREKKMALWPVLLMRSKSSSRDSLRMTPTSAETRGMVRWSSRKANGSVYASLSEGQQTAGAAPPRRRLNTVVAPNPGMEIGTRWDQKSCLDKREVSLNQLFTNRRYHAVLCEVSGAANSIT